MTEGQRMLEGITPGKNSIAKKSNTRCIVALVIVSLGLIACISIIVINYVQIDSLQKALNKSDDVYARLQCHFTFSLDIPIDDSTELYDHQYILPMSDQTFIVVLSNMLLRFDSQGINKWKGAFIKGEGYPSIGNSTFYYNGKIYDYTGKELCRMSEKFIYSINIDDDYVFLNGTKAIRVNNSCNEIWSLETTAQTAIKTKNSIVLASKNEFSVVRFDGFVNWTKKFDDSIINLLPLRDSCVILSESVKSKSINVLKWCEGWKFFEILFLEIETTESKLAKLSDDYYVIQGNNLILLNLNGRKKSTLTGSLASRYGNRSYPTATSDGGFIIRDTVHEELVKFNSKLEEEWSKSYSKIGLYPGFVALNNGSFEYLCVTPSETKAKFYISKFNEYTPINYHSKNC